MSSLVDSYAHVILSDTSHPEMHAVVAGLGDEHDRLTPTKVSDSQKFAQADSESRCPARDAESQYSARDARILNEVPLVPSGVLPAQKCVAVHR